MLFKDAEAIEVLCSVDTLVVDKTGTLTEGRPRLSAVEPQPGYSVSEMLSLAASVETSIGSVPGPTEVWREAGNLVQDHRAERAKEVAFYAHMAGEQEEAEAVKEEMKNEQEAAEEKKEEATEALKDVDPADDDRLVETSDDPDVAGNPPETKPPPPPSSGDSPPGDSPPPPPRDGEL